MDVIPSKKMKLTDDGAWLGIAMGMNRVFERFMGIYHFDDDDAEPVVTSSPFCRTITLKYTMNNISLEEMSWLSVLEGMRNYDATDGNPAVDINIYAQRSDSERRENYAWLKKEHPEDYAANTKPYKGLFDFELEFYFSENDWNMLMSKRGGKNLKKV